jgi:hypothetical protein
MLKPVTTDVEALTMLDERPRPHAAQARLDAEQDKAAAA